MRKKDKTDNLDADNLFYGITKRLINDRLVEWSRFTEYTGYYEVVFWTTLVDKPMKLIKQVKENE